MKKIFLATAAIVILASCSKNESELLKNSANEIKFSNLNDRVTRAANDAGDNYRIYANSTMTSEASWFINDVINGSNPDINKAQGGPYYWPAGETVDFYSYAPAGSTNAAVTPTYAFGAPTFSVVYTVPTAANEDFTIATPMLGLDKTAGSNTGTVDFTFNHMLSKIEVTATLSAALTASNYVINLTNATVTLTVASNQGTLNAMSGAATFTSIGGSPLPYTGAKSYMIMPQTSTGTKIQLNGVVITRNGVTVFPVSGGATDLKEYTILAGDVTDALNNTDVFLKNTHYTLNLELQGTSHDDDDELIFGEEIKFSATTATWLTGGFITPNPVQP